MIGTGLAVTTECDLTAVHQTIEDTLARMTYNPADGVIEHVIFFATPHWQHRLNDLSHQFVKATGCMQVWGGVAHGVYHNGSVAFDQPSVCMAIIAQQQGLSAENSIDLLMGHNDEELAQCRSDYPTNTSLIGLLSHGPDQRRYDKVQSGRPHTAGTAHTTIKASQVTVYDSAGLAPLGDRGLVTTVDGLTLRSVDGETAMTRLGSPSENTRPVGLRIGVWRDSQIQWIPLVAIHADGSATLAERVFPDEKMCLAARTSDKAEDELRQWVFPSSDVRPTNHYLGILMAGLDRSPLCHETDTELKQLGLQWPSIPMIGCIGQAVWVRHTNLKPDTTPLNHRLALALIER